MRSAPPRVAYLPDTFYEINGVAHTSRHFEAFALRRGLPFFCLHPGKRDSAIREQQQGELTTLDIPELVTAGLDDYAQRALKLAHTPALLASLREKLAHSRLTSPLFNTDLYCRQLESAYRVMWERSCRGEPPVAFDVPALR